MRIHFSPGAAPAMIAAAVQEKARRLTAAHAEGKEFFVFSAQDNRDAAEWILAGFASPLALVPLAPSLPKEARDRALSQLPGNWVEAEGLPGPAAQSAPKKEEAVWAVIFSSGSSGDPKGVALSGRALRKSAEAHARHNGSHHWLLNLPLHHVGGFSVLSRAYFLGSPVSVAQPRFDAIEAARWVEEGGVEGISLVPTTLHRLLEISAPWEKLRVALVGGGPAGRPLIERAERVGLPVRLTYGMTEHSSQIATEDAPASGLLALPGVDLKIAEDGEILVRSPFLAKGIYRQGRLDLLPLADGFFATGDLGRLENGRLQVEGRKSDMIITGGIKVFPAEIEPLLSLPGLKDAAISSVPDEEWGEKVCAALVGELSHDTVKSYLAGKIDPRKMPRAWVPLAEIPRSSTGKVLRAELRRQVREKLDWAKRESPL